MLAGQEKISGHRSRYKQEGIVPFVVDAVYAMAHALNNMRLRWCRGQKFCHRLDPPDGKELLEYIRNVSFIGKDNLHTL